MPTDPSTDPAVYGSELMQTTVDEAIDSRGVTFRLADPDHSVGSVRLWTDIGLHDPFAKVPGGWVLRVDDTGVQRLEYLLEIDGALVPDPGNPHRVPGPFGDKSWLSMPGYVEPTWLAETPIEAERASTVIETGAGPFAVEIWSPADAAADEELPLVLAHDGPEMDSFGALTHFIGTGIAAGLVPRCRVALLTPGPRNPRYSASPAYAAGLLLEFLPKLLALIPTREKPVLIGQSLGGLAALHAAWEHPGILGGVLLQSGSFFTDELDPQESGFEYFDQINRFTTEVHDFADAEDLEVIDPELKVAMVCGTAEENLENNRAMRQSLQRLGLTVSWYDVADGHTWTCWRDTLDPSLSHLLRVTWPEA